MLDYHWNNYILNDNKASLALLVSNGKEMEVKDLLFCFKIRTLSWIKTDTDSISNNANDRYSIESLGAGLRRKRRKRQVTDSWEFTKVYTRKIRPMITPKRLIYMELLFRRKNDCKFKWDLKVLKIAAYITYYLKLIDLKTTNVQGSDELSDNQWYVVSNTWIIGKIKEGN